VRPRLAQLLSGGVATWLVLAGGTIYVLLAGWLMASTPYNTWGALVAAPFVIAAGLWIVRHVLRGELADLRRIATIGLIAKVAGSLARYWVANDAYGGYSDSNTYHDVGRIIAGELWHGQISIVEWMPHTQGTRFIGELTGVLYAMVGSSRLAGFLWFGLMGFTGVALTVKAACLAVPGLHRRRYAWLCFLLPSLVFWPSSIGKEAWMSLVLGTASLGVAKVLRGRGRNGLSLLVVGLFGAWMVRPHMAAIWLASFVLAMTWSALTRRQQHERQGRGRILLFGAAGAAGLWALAQGTLTYLNPAKEVDASVTDILGLASARTSQGGSRFDPPVVDGPLDYPYAVVRTLTRPFLWEVNTLATVLPALEMVFLIGLLIASWRRVGGFPHAVRDHPYVLFAALVCFMGALAFSTFGNLAILVRQRSLLMPMLLVLPCLPIRERGREARPQSASATLVR
jgi:hypothetical protein